MNTQPNTPEGNGALVRLPKMAISIRQPWAWLIVQGHKAYENREWSQHNPGKKYRGPVLIHASSGMTNYEYDDAKLVAMRHGAKLPPKAELQRGGIIGQVDVDGWCDSPPEMPFAFTSGMLLSNAKPLPFFPCKGFLGFFGCNYPESLLENAKGEARSVTCAV